MVQTRNLTRQRVEASEKASESNAVEALMKCDQNPTKETVSRDIEEAAVQCCGRAAGHCDSVVDDDGMEVVACSKCGRENHKHCSMKGLCIPSCEAPPPEKSQATDSSLPPAPDSDSEYTPSPPASARSATSYSPASSVKNQRLRGIVSPSCRIDMKVKADTVEEARKLFLEKVAKQSHGITTAAYKRSNANTRAAYDPQIRAFTAYCKKGFLNEGKGNSSRVPLEPPYARSDYFESYLTEEFIPKGKKNDKNAPVTTAMFDKLKNAVVKLWKLEKADPRYKSLNIPHPVSETIKDIRTAIERKKWAEVESTLTDLVQENKTFSLEQLHLIVNTILGDGNPGLVQDLLDSDLPHVDEAYKELFKSSRSERTRLRIRGVSLFGLGCGARGDTLQRTLDRNMSFVHISSRRQNPFKLLMEDNVTVPYNGERLCLSQPLTEPHALRVKTITVKNKCESKEPVSLFLLSHCYVHLCGVGAVAQHKFVMRHDKPIDFADRSEYWSEALFQGEDADKKTTKESNVYSLGQPERVDLRSRRGAQG